MDTALDDGLSDDGSTGETMRGIIVQGGAGPASALHLAEIPKPSPDDGQILIRVHAAGINRPDIQQRLGKYPPPPGASDIIGLEVAGEVVKGGGRWKAGDKVCALLPGGGYAEYVLCDPRHALPIPAGLSFEQAASLPETVFTVYANLFEHGRLAAGETVMIHGATSGIGVTAIQMAKAAGAKVIATARGNEKAQAALALGADIAVDTNSEQFQKAASAAGGVDVVLDMVGGDYFPGNLEALNKGGRIVFIAALAGADVSLPVYQLMRKHAIVTGSTLRPRDAEEKARLAQEIERTVWPWIEAGLIKTKIDSVFPLDQAAEAHAHLEEGGHLGKLVLMVS